MIVKGILHPADAEKAVSIGVEGILVSNHGGRQIEALPAPIDCVPGIVKAVGSKATILFDSGVRSGTDVARALALGANCVLAGKAFLWSVGALGSDGPGHAIDLFIDELQSALGQVGAHSPADARNVMIRHPGAFDFERNHP
jgi:(S)-mandelate dehydrogenase